VSAEPSIDDHFVELTDSASAVAVDERKVVALVRAYLGAVRTHLADLHHSGGSGREVNEVHTNLMDRLIRRLFWFAEENFFSGGGEFQTDLAVIAVGGYSRREMSIYSDVDLLFLHRDTVTPFVRIVTERLQYWMWDAALQVGCSIRTIDETIDLAKRDLTVFTSILSPRLLAGSGVLFHEFAMHRRAELLRDPERAIGEQIAAARERHGDFGDSLYLLQPNVKEGEGALRDFHTAFWVMQTIQPGARRLEEFLHLNLLTEEEIASLFDALDFLWRIRNELHLVAGRKNDQMSFEFQEKMAVSLGYGDMGGRELPVERFMRDFYRYARSIHNHSSLVIEQCQARVRRTVRKRQVKEIGHGFRLAAGQLEIPHGRQLRDHPLDLLNAFAVAQQHDAPLTRKARRLIRENLHLIDDEFRSNPEAVAIFERILDSEKRVMRTLMMMNEEGVLAALLPEWEHIVCRWQHVMYHTYTVDVHTIFLVEQLRRLWKGKHEGALPVLTDMMRSVEDRAVLFLGCLLHDIGKGMGGDHSSKGAQLARACVERLGLPPERVDRVVFLVENHLLMSRLAQSRDLTDPKLIFDLARTVGDRKNLRDLYLLTFADIRASSSAAWTDWKGQLLKELFERTSEFIETGSDDESKAVELIESRVEVRRRAAAAELGRMGVAEADIQAYFDIMPRRYFISHAPRQIARHALVVLGLAEDKLMRTAVREMRGDFSELILCTKDVHGLYSSVAGLLTAHKINILASHVYTARSGLALEVYRVTTPAGGEAERRIAWREFDESLEAVLCGQTDVDRVMQRRGRRIGGQARPSERNPVDVRISSDESDFYTIVDVTANDRIGLLHALTRVISDRDHEVYISKAATVLDQVQDTFYLKSADGKKITDPQAVEELREALRAAAEGVEAARADDA
jgi:[protein-PII] uridylyltransferase